MGGENCSHKCERSGGKVFLDMWHVTWESKRPIISKMPAWIFPCHPLHKQTHHMALNAVTFPKNATWIGLLWWVYKNSWSVSWVCDFKGKNPVNNTVYIVPSDTWHKWFVRILEILALFTLMNNYATWKHSAEHNATVTLTICKSLKEYVGCLWKLSSLGKYGSNLSILFTLHKNNVCTIKHLVHTFHAIHFP